MAVAVKTEFMCDASLAVTLETIPNITHPGNPPPVASFTKEVNPRLNIISWFCFHTTVKYYTCFTHCVFRYWHMIEFSLKMHSSDFYRFFIHIQFFIKMSAVQWQIKWKNFDLLYLAFTAWVMSAWAMIYMRIAQMGIVRVGNMRVGIVQVAIVKELAKPCFPSCHYTPIPTVGIHCYVIHWLDLWCAPRTSKTFQGTNPWNRCPIH